MKLIFTHKAEVDGLGVAGSVVPGSVRAERTEAFLIVHGYAYETEEQSVAAEPVTAALKAPKNHGAMKPGRTA